jgi:hypothetical protein
VSSNKTVYFINPNRGSIRRPGQARNLGIVFVMAPLILDFPRVGNFQNSPSFFLSYSLYGERVMENHLAKSYDPHDFEDCF